MYTARSASEGALGDPGSGQRQRQARLDPHFVAAIAEGRGAGEQEREPPIGNGARGPGRSAGRVITELRAGTAGPQRIRSLARGKVVGGQASLSDLQRNLRC
jgi:hypothetical protein